MIECDGNSGATKGEGAIFAIKYSSRSSVSRSSSSDDAAAATAGCLKPPRSFPLALPAVARPGTSTLPELMGGEAAAPTNAEDDAGSIVVVFVFIAGADAVEAAIRDAASSFLASAIIEARSLTLPLLALLVPLLLSFDDGSSSGAGTSAFVVFVGVVTDAARSFTMALFMLLLLLDESAGAGTGAFVVFVGVVADGARSFTMALLVLLLLLDESAGTGVGVGPGVFVGIVADDSRYFTLTLIFGVVVVDFIGVGVVVVICVVADGADGVP